MVSTNLETYINTGYIPLLLSTPLLIGLYKSNTTQNIYILCCQTKYIQDMGLSTKFCDLFATFDQAHKP